MAAIKEVINSDIIIGKLSYGSDLLGELTEICIKKNVSLGRIEAIGAVQKACIGYYNQKKREYRFINFDTPAEILNLTGNISIKDDKPFVHAHITLADEAGNACGGHLAPGTIIFACECIIYAFSGAGLIRSFDNQTGLPLWSF